MKSLFFTTVISIVFTANLFCQTKDSFFIDNNPKLTYLESEWLNSVISRNNFDFTNKYVGFVELLSGGFYGIGKFTLPVQKKNLQQFITAKFENRLIVLDSTEKILTRGYDAILVLVNNKNSRKISRLNTEKLINESKNRYPQIPAAAGLDSNSLLSQANAKFFEELYKADLYPKTDFDFNGKKIAIFNTLCQYEKAKRVSITEYVERIRSQLDIYGYSMADFTYYLDEGQKKASGGYDVIIEYFCKGKNAGTYLVNLLIKEVTN